MVVLHVSIQILTTCSIGVLRSSVLGSSNPQRKQELDFVFVHQDSACSMRVYTTNSNHHVTDFLNRGFENDSEDIKNSLKLAKVPNSSLLSCT